MHHVVDDPWNKLVDHVRIDKLTIDAVNRPENDANEKSDGEGEGREDEVLKSLQKVSPVWKQEGNKLVGLRASANS